MAEQGYPLGELHHCDQLPRLVRVNTGCDAMSGYLWPISKKIFLTTFRCLSHQSTWPSMRTKTSSQSFYKVFGSHLSAFRTVPEPPIVETSHIILSRTTSAKEHHCRGNDRREGQTIHHRTGTSSNRTITAQKGQSKWNSFRRISTTFARSTTLTTAERDDLRSLCEAMVLIRRNLPYFSACQKGYASLFCPTGVYILAPFLFQVLEVESLAICPVRLLWEPWPTYRISTFKT